MHGSTLECLHQQSHPSAKCKYATATMTLTRFDQNSLTGMMLTHLLSEDDKQTVAAAVQGLSADTDLCPKLGKCTSTQARQIQIQIPMWLLDGT